MRLSKILNLNLYMFINISNHPSDSWDLNQLNSAHQLGGEIIDIPFPNVDPMATSDKIKEIATNLTDSLIKNFSPNDVPVIHIMGEMTLTFYAITLLKKKGYKCLASTTRREVTENPDGSKNVYFKFIQFREY